MTVVGFLLCKALLSLSGIITISSPALWVHVLMVPAWLLLAQCPCFLCRRLCHLLVLLPGALRGEACCHPADEHLPAVLTRGQRRPHTHPATSLPGLPEGRPEQGTASLRGHIWERALFGDPKVGNVWPWGERRTEGCCPFNSAGRAAP